MVGFPPRSMLLQYLTLSPASGLCRGSTGTQWSGNAAVASNGEAGEGFSKAGLGFAAPGRTSWGFCCMRGTGWCSHRVAKVGGTGKIWWVWLSLAGTGGEEVSGW